MWSRASGTSRERSGDEGVHSVPLALLADSRSDSYPLRCRIHVSLTEFFPPLQGACSQAKQWQDEEHEFVTAQASLIQYCIEKHDVMAKEIHKVEDQAFLDERETDVSEDEEVTKSNSRKSTAPTCLRQGLTSVVVSSPRVFSKLDAKLNLKKDDPT